MFMGGALVGRFNKFSRELAVRAFTKAVTKGMMDS